MAWKPSYLTRKQMEERRLDGGRLLKAGKLSQAEIARQLGVSRATVSDWAKKVEKAGIRGLYKRIKNRWQLLGHAKENDRFSNGSPMIVGHYRQQSR